MAATKGKRASPGPARPKTKTVKPRTVPATAAPPPHWTPVAPAAPTAAAPRPEWTPAAPAAPAVAPPWPAQRPTADLARALTWLIVATLAYGAVNFVILLTVEFRFSLIMLLGMASFLLSVPTIIVFCMWLHRTLSNARDRAPLAGIHPGWAVGSFFVPFVQLVVPLLEVRRAWVADTGRPGTLVVVWLVAWSLLTLTGFVTGIASAVDSVQQALDDDQADETVQERQEAAVRAQRPYQGMSLALNIVAGVALILVARQWTALQGGAPAS